MRKSLGLPPDAELELVNPETQYRSIPFPWHHNQHLSRDQLDDEEPAATSHHKFQKDGEPVQMLLQADCEGHKHS